RNAYIGASKGFRHAEDARADAHTGRWARRDRGGRRSADREVARRGTSTGAGDRVGAVVRGEAEPLEAGFRAPAGRGDDAADRLVRDAAGLELLEDARPCRRLRERGVLAAFAEQRGERRLSNQGLDGRERAALLVDGVEQRRAVRRSERRGFASDRVLEPPERVEQRAELPFGIGGDRACRM